MDIISAIVEPQMQLQKLTDNSTILIIEDDPLQLDFLEDGLSRQGFNVLAAMTCDGGMRIARSERPDVILLDVLLPDGDGLRVCEKLVDDPQTIGIPIIIVSGSDKEDIVWLSRCSGSQYFLRKPFDPNTLLVLINQALDETRSC